MINPETYRDGFTQSEFTMLGNCATKWNNRYNLRLVKQGSFSFPLIVGTIVHSALEVLYQTNFQRIAVATLQFPEGFIPSIEDIAKAEYWNAVIPAMIRGYTNYWMLKDACHKVISFEEELEVQYRGYILRGKVDLTTQGPKGINIWDHKTTSRIDRETVTGWDFRFQFMFYLWLRWIGKISPPSKGYYINALKKPQLRIKVKESVQAFAIRCQQDMIERPEEYFYREQYPVTDEILQHFQDSVVDPKLDFLYLADENPELLELKNTDECQRLGRAPCPYIDSCRFGMDRIKHLYTRLDKKHLELDITETD